MEAMLNSTIFVQEPDYTGFRKKSVPVQVLGSVYDGLDPYATSLGIVLMILEQNYAKQVYVPRSTKVVGAKTAYVHDLKAARYVANRNGFEEAQMQLGQENISAEARTIITSFLEQQNSSEMNRRYLVEVRN